VEDLDIAREVRRIDLPVLLVFGDQDDIVTPFNDRDFSGSEFVRQIFLSESGHFPMLDECPKFNRLLRDYLVAENVNSLALKDEWRRQTR
jgi:pimeloyl-ACP methyl ester carboxylesterase